MSQDTKVALVSGGAKRVGRAIVQELARKGFHVVIHYQTSHNEAESLAGEIRTTGVEGLVVRGDLHNNDECQGIIDSTLDHFGRLDVLINNAASFLTSTPDNIEAFDPVLWGDMLQVNLIAPMALCYHARRHLAVTGSGVIVNLCDISADRPWPNHLAYCCSKAGLVALTKGLARSLAPAIRVVGVSPGIAVFPDGYAEETKQALIDKVPMKRPGTPEDIAKLVAFVSEDATYVTGEIIKVDGGRHLS